jgi:hypothetical protein
MGRAMFRALAVLTIVCAAAGCAQHRGGNGRGAGEGERGGEGEGARADDSDGGVVAPAVDAGVVDGGVVVLDGHALFESMCSICHGDMAQGTSSAPQLAGWSRGRDALVSTISTSMPLGNAGACDANCAGAIADWILSLGSSSTSTGTDACASASSTAFPPRQIRLLTRSELNATIASLLADVHPSCASDADCFGGAREHCGVDAKCHVDGCATTTFSFTSSSAGNVSLAGDFNNWSPSPMTKSNGVWSDKITLADGSHQYKFVVDGNWIVDPNATSSSPDGFGGQNSVVIKSCAGVTDPPDVPFAQDFTSNFPVETRPDHYPFDNSAALALVTSDYVDAARTAALAIGEAAARDPSFTIDVATFGRRAFRRPLDDGEVSRFTARLQSDGVARVIASMLLSPQLLYATEVGVVDASGTTATLTPFEAASTLSYMITGAPPDDALLDAAQNGHLATGDDRAAQATRLLSTSAAKVRLENIAVQWLGVEPVLTSAKSAQFSDFTPQVRTAMVDEAKHMWSAVVFDGSGKLDDLFTTSTTFLAPSLASFYGVPASGGVSSTAPNGRRGVLGLGAVLATFAYPDQTSPPRRGVWFRDRLMCQVLGTPPPNAGAIPAVDDSGTTRQRFAQHETNATCNSCHQYIDGVGFGFEHYDAVGRWRDVDNGQPVDASGDVLGLSTLGDGTSAPFSDLNGLAQILASDDRATTCFATQIYRYAHGKLDDANDACAIQRIAQDFGAHGRNVQELIVDVVRDDSFVTRSVSAGVTP